MVHWPFGSNRLTPQQRLRYTLWPVLFTRMTGFVERVAAGAPCLLRRVARSEAWPLRLTQTNAQRSVLGFLRGTAEDDIPIRGVLF